MGEEIRTSAHEIKNLRGFINNIVWLLRLACFVCFILWLYSGFGSTYIILSIALFFATSCVNAIKIVQKTEIWIIERFGQYHRKLGPGIHWTIPWVETVRAKPRLFERPLEMFNSQPEIVFRDGTANLKDPKVFIELNENTVENAVYKIDNWGKWVVEVLEPIVRGYLNTLSLTEALDEGAARGNILDRLTERPEITKIQIERIESRIRKITRKINELEREKKDVGILKATKEEWDKEKIETEDRMANQNRLKKELERFIKDAEERGFKKIHRMGVGEFDIPDDLEHAREEIHRAQKEAVAAISRAVKETIMRIEPIVKTKERFKDMGFSEEEARDKAFEIEIIETLATNRSLFLTGGKGEIQTLAAQLAAIFTEVSGRRKEPEKKPGEKTTK